MTKKETLAFQELQEQLRTAAGELAQLRALRWSEAFLPDVPIPTNAVRLSTGYTYNAHYNAGHTGDRVQPACSSLVSHGIGSTTATTTRGPLPLYSTELRALKALRHDVVLQCAQRLALIDLRIENEERITGS